MNKRERMYERIRQHGELLQGHFGIAFDAVQFCKKLRRLEVKANGIMTDYCNGVCSDEDVDNYVLGPLKDALIKIFGERGFRDIYINHDPRGYTLKLNEIATARIPGIYRDLGGYGIIAPVFSK